VDVVDGKTLIGVAPDGRIHVKAGDVGWQRLGRLPDGQAAAFTAVAGLVHAAVLGAR
jgi:hypothetical protein